VGHQIIADQILNAAELDQVWLMLSPQNPLKKKASLLNQYDRLHLVELATQNHQKLIPSDFEFNLPVPSYTIDTLTHLTEKYHQHEFSLIMGGDNLESLKKWKNYEQLIENYKILVYARPGASVGGDLLNHKNVRIFEFPQMDVSSSFIRNQIKAGKSAKYFLDASVEAYIKEMNLYK
jgi:nicotinate-nucleotide adenylyltransferase